MEAALDQVFLLTQRLTLVRAKLSPHSLTLLPLKHLEAGLPVELFACQGAPPADDGRSSFNQVHHASSVLSGIC